MVFGISTMRVADVRAVATFESGSWLTFADTRMIPQQCRLEPQSPISTVPLSGLFDDEFQCLRAIDVQVVPWTSCVLDRFRTEDFVAVGPYDENDPERTGLMSCVQAGFAV